MYIFNYFPNSFPPLSSFVPRNFVSLNRENSKLSNCVTFSSSEWLLLGIYILQKQFCFPSYFCKLERKKNSSLLLRAGKYRNRLGGENGFKQIIWPTSVTLGFFYRDKYRRDLTSTYRQYRDSFNFLVFCFRANWMRVLMGRENLVYWIVWKRTLVGGEIWVLRDLSAQSFLRSKNVAHTWWINLRKNCWCHWRTLSFPH